MSLSTEEESTYSYQIDAILAGVDIQTVSAKKIRLALQQDLDHDISHQKSAINALISQRFDKFTARKEAENGQPLSAPVTNGSATHKATPNPRVKSESATPSKREGSSDLSDLVDSASPKKKAKQRATEDDAAYAARLQAELNNSARPTRGGGPKPKPAPKKKTPKKKSANKVTAEDDSDVESNGDDAEKSERGGAFNKPMYLSQPLKDLLGEEKLSRPKTVKGIWDYIKEHDLQKPDDKRQIMCDDRLRAVFKKDEVHMFTMNKILSSHLTPIED